MWQLRVNTNLNDTVMCRYASTGLKNSPYQYQHKSGLDNTKGLPNWKIFVNSYQHDYGDLTIIT